MRPLFFIAIACVAGLASGVPLLAHHSGAAEFDRTKKIDLTGVVTRVEWTNPHAHFYMDVKDASGSASNWNLELASPNVLLRNGWKRSSLKPGDTVTVTGIQAKDSSHYASAGVITFPDGHKLTFLSADDPSK
ncbi:MAG TPA: DUF6152 family protein [Bryobacteraceae bacterium]|nr:DUF6152 family protein [Bryobacteraceae bacterium]